MKEKYLSKIFLFDAAHKLENKNMSPERNKEIYGKCSNIHGHTYKLIVSVCGDVDETDMVINFGELKENIDACVISVFDHSFLNELECLKGKNPTAENLAEVIWDMIDEMLKGKNSGLELKKIELYETPTSFYTMEKMEERG
jgi:6-pyruvoyltetrahydropterin/6-carboxytetrahydropterin synthase